jgi:transcriptional regulator with XRE-family HTH domain
MLTELARIRTEKGISQKDLAAAVGIEPPNLCHYEKARHEPLVSTAVRLASALGVSVEELCSELERGNDV